jgi:pullulanase/glycogen debranching enzyme
MTSNFFAPESRYAAVDGQQVLELKELVRAFHERGVAVFMDVVYIGSPGRKS